MKILGARTLLCAAVATLLITPSSFAKTKATLSAFAGKYTGFVTLTNSGSTTAGVAVVTITVPKNGKSATIAYSAIFDSGGMTSILPADFTLAKTKAFSTTDLGIGIAGTNNAHPGTGNWSQSKRKLTMFATNGTTNLQGSGAVKDTRKKRKLTLNFVSSDGATNYVFTTTLTAKKPKVKK